MNVVKYVLNFSKSAHAPSLNHSRIYSISKKGRTLLHSQLYVFFFCDHTHTSHSHAIKIAGFSTKLFGNFVISKSQMNQPHVTLHTHKQTNICRLIWSPFYMRSQWWNCIFCQSICRICMPFFFLPFNENKTRQFVLLDKRPPSPKKQK